MNISEKSVLHPGWSNVILKKKSWSHNFLHCQRLHKLPIRKWFEVHLRDHTPRFFKRTGKILPFLKSIEFVMLMMIIMVMALIVVLMSVHLLLYSMKNSRAYGIDKGKGGKSFIYCRVKTQLSTYSSLREPRSSPFVYSKINSLIYGQGFPHRDNTNHSFPIWK